MQTPSAHEGSNSCQTESFKWTQESSNRYKSQEGKTMEVLTHNEASLHSKGSGPSCCHSWWFEHSSLNIFTVWSAFMSWALKILKRIMYILVLWDDSQVPVTTETKLSQRVLQRETAQARWPVHYGNAESFWGWPCSFVEGSNMKMQAYILIILKPGS